MKYWMKAMELKLLMSRMAKLKDQFEDIREDIRFRKPWTTRSESRPLLYMALGAGIAWLFASLYKNRTEVADFCATCGATLKDSWERSGIKDKTRRAMEKAKDMRGAMATSGNGQEPTY